MALSCPAMPTTINKDPSSSRDTTTPSISPTPLSAPVFSAQPHQTTATPSSLSSSPNESPTYFLVAAIARPSRPVRSPVLFLPPFVFAVKPKLHSRESPALLSPPAYQFCPAATHLSSPRRAKSQPVVSPCSLPYCPENEEEMGTVKRIEK
ncbi:hypothetical protein M0R45_008827 [Rubus argutus]|uniref:Uncharacterized protein n=1 Tax=Rubus argutus TaxID=59490 RepID=A0AAW1Y424_RUBAR